VDVTFGGAVVAGVVSFISPCVLPLVPPYLCFLAGVSIEELAEARRLSAARRRILGSALAFVAGFTTVFVALGATASAIGQGLRLLVYSTVTVFGVTFNPVSLVAGLLIMVMGLHFLGLFRVGLFYREARMTVAQKPPGVLGAYLIGLAFAIGWTPCIGPVLTAILAVAGSEDTVSRGAALLGAYSLGLGVPFVAAAIFAESFLSWAGRFRRHLGRVEKAMGAMLVATGILFVTGQMASFSFWLLETFPALGRIG